MTFGIMQEEKRATDLQDGELDLKILDRHCVSWGVGLLRFDVCVDLSVPEADVSVYLLSVQIAWVKLDRDHLCAHVGGSVGRVKAVADVCLELDPVKVVLDAELCVPLAPCKKYHIEIPLSPGEDMDG